MSTPFRADSARPGRGPADDIDLDDRAAFYRSHLPYVLAVLTRGFRVPGREECVHRVTDPTEAEDLTQETFAAFFRQVETGNFDRSRPAVPYLRRIAVNLALRRAGQRAREVQLEDLPEPAVQPSTSVEDGELRELMTSFRAALSERERAVLECMASEELDSQAAMGERVGLSRDQVYRTLVGIRKRATIFFREKGWLP